MPHVISIIRQHLAKYLKSKYRQKLLLLLKTNSSDVNGQNNNKHNK